MLAGLGHLLGREPPRLDRTGLPLARAGHALAHLVRLAVVVAGKAVALVLTMGPRNGSSQLQWRRFVADSVADTRAQPVCLAAEGASTGLDKMRI